MSEPAIPLRCTLGYHLRYLHTRLQTTAMERVASLEAQLESEKAANVVLPAALSAARAQVAVGASGGCRVPPLAQFVDPRAVRVM